MDESLLSTVSAAAVAAALCVAETEKDEEAEKENDLPVESTNKVSCSETHFILSPTLTWQETCLINETEVIDAEDFHVASKVSTVSVLYMIGNEDIAYLPVGLHKTFPTLYDISAQLCSIKKVSKENFRGLKDLTYIRLSGNLLESIDGATFKGLGSLVDVDLSESIWLKDEKFP